MRRSDFPVGRHLLKQINGKRTESIEDSTVSSGDDGSQSARGKRKSRGRDLIDSEGSDDDDSDGVANISMERTTFEKADKSGKASVKDGRNVTSASSSSRRKGSDGSGPKRRKLSSDEDDDERAGGKENKRQESRRKEKNDDKKGSKDPASSALSKRPKSPPSSSLKVIGSQESVFNDKPHKKPTITYRNSQEKKSGKATFKKVPPIPSPQKSKSTNHATGALRIHTQAQNPAASERSSYRSVRISSRLRGRNRRSSNLSKTQSHQIQAHPPLPHSRRFPKTMSLRRLHRRVHLS